MQVYAKQGDTLDMICQRYFGRTAGITEQVLAANRGVAELGAVLPLGQVIQLPDQAPQAQRAVIQLWD
ncbi:P2-like prophage tail protein X [Andreprevotia lacus DSM 23236]|jgi:phage tail protein X|uniref:p2-like prophage tail protein X n=1 Tax=Andreprevotia lacus DSM 23236 TaxID=1121001 RepID=A0A1W1XKU6_9NEIS|nr:tail protein X [Andreprevotia lacus]SMC24171.1 P2-like prophage tail protein X [Andreprevotia lacus DSM 23236]